MRRNRMASVAASMMMATHQQLPINLVTRKDEPVSDGLTDIGRAALLENEWPMPHVHKGQREVERRQRQAERQRCKKLPSN